MFPMIDKERTGIRLKYLMRAKGLTPRDIQKYLSLSCVQTVYRWLEGVNVPSIDNLYALAGLFRVKIDEMVVGSRRQDFVLPDTRKKRMFLYYMRLCGNSSGALL